MDLFSNISKIKGVGIKTLEKLNKNNIFTIKDIILRLPKRYDLYCKEDINTLTDDKKVLLNGRIISFYYKKINRYTVMEIVKINTGKKNYEITFFGNQHLYSRFYKNQVVSICAKYNYNLNKLYGFKIFLGNFTSFINVSYLLKDISDNVFSKLVKKVINEDFNLIDILPGYIILKYRLLNYKNYIIKSHFPKSKEDLRQLRRRKKYTDFLKYCVSLEILEDSIIIKKKSNRDFNRNEVNNFINNLDYKLTDDQLNALKDVLDDIKSNRVMNRLIEGDVGSGKTIVAFIAMYAEILSNRQVCLMAPSELLSYQHYNKFKKLFKNYNFNTALLNSSIKAKDKRKIILGLKNGSINCLITTQAVLYNDNLFSNLGLLVIDEQHRFGVNQRAFLLDKNDVEGLYLSATPIPRTLGLVKYNDLSISKIYQKPKGRKDIKTEIIGFKDINNLRDEILKEILKKHQVFVIVSKIEDDDFSIYDLNKAEDLFSKLFLKANIACISSKLSDKEKNDIMNDFSNHKIDILISTTVVEVGIDIKDATRMFILNADRFGLSTLHQLRGRIGRNSLESYCYLVSDKSNNERLNILINSKDCFEIADADFKLRGPGDFLGTNQSGFIDLDFENDFNIYNCALQDSKEVIKDKDLYFNKVILNELKNKNNNLN